MKKSIHNPHDKLLFKSLKDLRVGKDFIQAYLPKELLKDVNLDVIKLYHTKMVSPQYQEFEADVIYEIQVKNQPALLMLHCEHQSEPDKDAPLRIWQYILLLLQEYRTNNPDKPLPLIYPMILYTGKRPYNYSTYFFDLFAQQDLAKQYLFSKIPLVDVHRISDEDMRKRLWFGLVEFSFKHRKDKEFKAFVETFFPWIPDASKINVTER